MQLPFSAPLGAACTAGYDLPIIATIVVAFTFILLLALKLGWWMVDQAVFCGQNRPIWAYEPSKADQMPLDQTNHDLFAT